MKKENRIFKRLMTFAIAATMCMTTLAVLPTVSAGEFIPGSVTDQTPTAPLANPTPVSYQPRYISGFGIDDSFTVFFENRDAGNLLSYVSTTTGPTGFPSSATLTNIADTHFCVKDWPINIAGTDYNYRAWASVGNNMDHKFYVSNDLATWTLVSSFTIPNAAGFTGARGWVYYGFHDVIQLNGKYYAFAESNQGQTMLCHSTNGNDVWEAFDSVGGTQIGDGPLQMPESITPSGNFIDLGNNRGFGKLHIRGNDAGCYLAINTEATQDKTPAEIEAAFIDPNNWMWNDGSTGLPSATPILSETSEHDLRECWVVPNSDPNADWVIIYDADFGSADGGKALGYATLTPPMPPPMEVWVDDDYYSGGTNDGHTWQYDAFDVIQDAIDAVCDSGTVYVAAGTYIEQININKPLTLTGAGQDNTHIVSPDPITMTIYDLFGSKGPDQRYIVHRGTNIPVVRIAASDVTFEGFHVNLNDQAFFDVKGSFGIDYSKGVGILVDHVETNPGTPDEFTGITIQYNKVDGLFWDDYSDCIKAMAQATVNINNNILYGYGESAVSAQGMDTPRAAFYPTVTANDNTMYGGSGARGGNHFFFGVGYWSGATGSADGNTIYNAPNDNGYALNSWTPNPVSFTNNVITTDGGSVGGYGAQLYESSNLVFSSNDIEKQGLAGAIWKGGGTGITITISNNEIINCIDGFIGDGLTAGSVTLHYNNFEGTADGHYALDMAGHGISIWGSADPCTITADAECNWWGAHDGPSGNGPGTGDAVSNNVDFDPWIGITDLSGPTDPVQLGDPANIDFSFTCNKGTATLDWDDGTQFTYLTESETTTESHTYSAAGVYTVTLTIKDCCGRSYSREFRYVVVYDPDDGFVTGGGWIMSPAGAYKPDLSLEGKANFGFVSKYKKGQSTPTGNTEFKFEMADLDFHSDNYDWLVIAGAKAMYKGTGTINDVGPYKFMLTARDDTPDTFRIKIWEEDESGDETIIYDNGTDTQLGGGQIKIHKN